MLTSTRRRVVADDRGQAVTALVVTFALAFLAFGLLFLAPVSTAGSQVQQLQTAADAAALAGAQAAAKESKAHVVGSIVDGTPIPGSLGQSAAADFASRNGARLVSYSYNPVSDQVRVRVRSRAVLESGNREERTATAELGNALGPCERLPSIPSSWEDLVKDMTCGALNIPVMFPAGASPFVQWALDQWLSKFDPRLTS